MKRLAEKVAIVTGNVCDEHLAQRLVATALERFGGHLFDRKRCP